MHNLHDESTVLGGDDSATPLNQALALAGALTGAELVALDTGVSLTRWGQGDLPSRLPLIKAQVRVLDATSDPRFLSESLITQHGVRSLVAVPIQRTPGASQGTLWLLSHQPNRSFELKALEQLVAVISGLLAPATDEMQLYSWVATLPTAAVCVMGEMLIANSDACTLTGYGNELSTFHGWTEALYGERAAELRAQYAADQAQGFLDVRTLPIRRKDGTDRLLEFNCTSVGGAELWLLTDVTERVASQERFRLLFEQSSTAHLLFDEQGIVDCNPASVALLGYSDRVDLLQRRPRDLSPDMQPDGQPSEEKGQQMKRIAYQTGMHRFDWEHRRADGSPLMVEVTLTPLTLGPRRVLLAEWHDITERLRYQEGLENARDSALKFARAKADFLATMSHEIRTPMNGVIGMTHLLLDTPLTSAQRDCVDTIRACGEGLLALINDILDFSRIDAGKVALERIDFSVQDLLEDALAVVASSAYEKGLQLSVRLGEDVPDRVFGDPTRVRQVLLNLLSNAVKFTTSGEVTVGIESARTDDFGRRLLTLSVSDTGPGIAQEALPRLFTAFSQEDTSTTRRFGGSGLGLAICKRLVSLMGGQLEVVTSPRGSQFTVTLTLDDAGSDDVPPDLRGRTVLVVDTHPVSRHLLTRLIERTGARALAAADVPSALSQLASSELVLVDHALEAFGLEQLVAGRRVVMVTPMVGSNAPSEIALTLPKPIRRRQLFSVLERALSPSGLLAAEGLTAPKQKFAGVRVLVAEDNAVNQRVIRGLLERLGCAVMIVDNGARALDALSQATVDLVLMDCQMPELDGLEATRRLRARETGARLAVVALTAGVMAGDKERCLEAGMDDFLAKPVRLDELERALRTWCAASRSRAAVSAA